MAKTTKKATAADEQLEAASSEIPKLQLAYFSIWICGRTPLICHAWSQKAKAEMLGKQTKRTREGREVRNPEEDFLASLYAMAPGIYGFPSMAVKKALLSCAHKDRGIPREVVKKALWVDAEMTQTRPALAGAVCDMPLIRIWGSSPQMREDMVRVGAGMKKTASLSYRAQFEVWALHVTGQINTALCPTGWLPYLARHSGLSTGIGDWRNERDGIFGAYRLGSPQQVADWEAFREWRLANPDKAPEDGPLPKVPSDDDFDIEEVAA